MKIFLLLAPLLILLLLGTLLARRWVTNPSSKSKRSHQSVRFIALILVCWAGTIPAGNTQTQVSIMYFDPADYPGDKGLTADIVYDGVGNNVASLFFGWIIGPICVGLANALPKKHKFKWGSFDS